jgi:hypothetical protein
MPTSQFGLRTRLRRTTENSTPNYDFENERKAFRGKMTTSRMQNRESYWQMQTQVENKFFQDYREERHRK